jgi:hypothetical protein
MNTIRIRLLLKMAFSISLCFAGTLYAQEPVGPQPPEIAQEVAVKNPTAQCIEPPPVVTPQDYTGPLKKTVGLFTQQLERKTVHPPHFKTGSMLCTFDVKDKFILFVRDSVDPVVFLGAGFNAGISQAQNDDPTFGLGIRGYAKRYAASYGDQANFRFFKDFAYPSIFREDPRYYRLAHGSGGKRFLHAVEHVVVAHTDHGNQMFNVSEWLGTVSAVSLSNVYHPGNKRGVTPTVENVGISFASDIGYDLLREFWPEISRKLDLPFRAEPADVSDLNPAAK